MEPCGPLPASVALPGAKRPPGAAAGWELAACATPWGALDTFSDSALPSPAAMPGAEMEGAPGIDAAEDEADVLSIPCASSATLWPDLSSVGRLLARESFV